MNESEQLSNSQLVMDSQNLQKALEELPLSPTHNVSFPFKCKKARDLTFVVLGKDAFERKLTSVKALYDTLFFALDQYTLQVSDARVST
jgi:hypothetical protein